jgi:hypothetical protein
MKAHDTWLGSTTGHIFALYQKKVHFVAVHWLPVCVGTYIYIYIKKKQGFQGNRLRKGSL